MFEYIYDLTTHAENALDINPILPLKIDETIIEDKMESYESRSCFNIDDEDLVVIRLKRHSSHVSQTEINVDHVMPTWKAMTDTMKKLSDEFNVTVGYSDYCEIILIFNPGNEFYYYKKSTSWLTLITSQCSIYYKHYSEKSKIPCHIFEANIVSFKPSEKHDVVNYMFWRSVANPLSIYPSPESFGSYYKPASGNDEVFRLKFNNREHIYYELINKYWCTEAPIVQVEITPKEEDKIESPPIPPKLPFLKRIENVFRCPSPISKRKSPTLTLEADDKPKRKVKKSHIKKFPVKNVSLNQYNDEKES